MRQLRKSALRRCVRITAAFLLASLALPALAKDLQLTVPDTGTYCYWIQSTEGDIAVLPKSFTNQDVLNIPGRIASGNRLYVLDARTGNVASHPIVADPAGDPLPIEFTVVDFQPIQAPYLASSKPHEDPSGYPHKDGVFFGFGHPWSFALGVLVALPLFWLISRLYALGQMRLQQAVAIREAAVPDTAQMTPGVVYTPPSSVASRRIEEPPAQSAQATLRRNIVSLPPKPARPRRPYLVGLQGLAAGSIFTLSDDFVMVGRDGDNGIVLAENTVSRQHASFTHEADGHVSIRDEDSANGIFVNGMRVEHAILAPGDELQIGESHFRFEI